MQFWKMSPMCRPTADSQWGVSGIHSLSLRRHVIRSPRPYKLYLNLISVCDCVTDETQCLPWEDRSLENDVHSSWVLSGLQFSRRELFWQFLLRGPCLRTIIQDVFVSYLKNSQQSQIGPIIHILDFCSSCIKKQNKTAMIASLSVSVGMFGTIKLISIWLHLHIKLFFCQ